MLLALALTLLQAPAPPDTTGALLTNAGVLRAAGKVDSVFVTRTLDSALVDGADWAAYLMARLGVRPIPESGLRITIDPRTLRVKGRLSDIPAEGQASLAPLMAMFDPATPFAASVTLDAPAPDAIRFHLDSAWVDLLAIPEAMLGPGLQIVGEKYPVLANGGRDLFVSVPANATVRFTSAGVVLLAPPPPPPPAAPHRAPSRPTRKRP
jgi:hypothetical protein